MSGWDKEIKNIYRLLVIMQDKIKIMLPYDFTYIFPYNFVLIKNVMDLTYLLYVDQNGYVDVLRSIMTVMSGSINATIVSFTSCYKMLIY